MQVSIYIDTGEGEGDKLKGINWHEMSMEEDTGTFNTWKRILRVPLKMVRFIITITTYFEGMLIGDINSPFYSSMNTYFCTYTAIPMALVGLIFGGLDLIPF